MPTRGDALVEPLPHQELAAEPRWLAAAMRWMLGAANALVAFLAIAVTASVVSRYFFGRSIVVLFEASEYSLLLMTMATAAYLSATDGHVRMELTSELASPWLVRLLDGISELIGAGIALALTYAGVVVTYANFRSGATTSGIVAFPRWWILMAVPGGAGLLVAQQSLAFIRRIVSLSRAPMTDSEA